MTTFRSTISEFRFGQQFEKNGFEIKYDFPYDKQEPDWTIIHNNEVAICEMYRLGKSKNDEIISDCYDAIMNDITALQYPYWVKISFNEYFDINTFEVKKVTNQFKKWLTIHKTLNDFFSIDGIELKIVKIIRGLKSIK